MKKSVIKNQIWDYTFFAVGSFVYAAAINIFIIPGNMVLGGVVGISTILNRLIPIPIGMLTLLFNIPLFIFAYKELGGLYLKKIAIATVISNIFIDLLTPVLPQFNGDLFLSALYGGILSGAGMGIIMLRGGTTGGIDIVAMIVNKRNPSFSIGKIILFIDIFVVVLSGVISNDPPSMLYSLIVIYCSSKAIDTVLYGLVKNSLIFIVTTKPDEIFEEISKKVGRGMTRIEATGSYTRENKTVLICAARRNEILKIKQISANVDPKSFLILGEASDIVGEGFFKDN